MYCRSTDFNGVFGVVSVAHGGHCYKTALPSPLSAKGVRSTPYSSGTSSEGACRFSFSQSQSQLSPHSPYQSGHTNGSGGARAGSIGSSLSSLQSRSPSPQTEPVLLRNPSSDDSGISLGFTPRPRPAGSHLPPRPHGDYPSKHSLLDASPCGNNFLHFLSKQRSLVLPTVCRDLCPPLLPFILLLSFLCLLVLFWLMC